MNLYMKSKSIIFFATPQRDVMGDLYKDLLNSFPDKENIIAVVPNAYSLDEFSDDFFIKIHENVSNISGRFKRWFEIIKLMYRIKRLNQKYNAKYAYFQIDQIFLDLVFYMFNRNLKYTMWVHDVTEHDGETFLFKFKKRLMENILYKRFNNIVVSYKEAAKEIKRKLHDEKINVEILKLPQLKELEFADIKNSNLPIMYDFIFYGRIEKYKGLELLLKVMTDNEMSKVKLLIVGRGRDDKNIVRQVEKLDNVDFINEYVPNRKLAEYIKQSRYVILPYKTATGSQTIQLANYYNKLILATRVGCFPEYIIEGANGFLIDDITYDCLKESMKKIMKIDSNNYTYKIMKEYDSFNLGIISNKLYQIITKDQ